MAGAATRERPSGWYLPGEVGQLAGVSGEQVGQWARYGYMQSAWKNESPRAYAYQDVAEAMVLHFLVEHGVPYPSIMKAVREATRHYGKVWPLSSARLYVIPDDPRVKGPKETVVVDDFDVDANHPVLGELDLVEVRRELEGGGWAKRTMPELRHIRVDPAVRSGTPVIAGTRIPVEDVARLAATSAGRAILTEDYDLSEAQVRDAERWYEMVTSYRDVRFV